MKSPFIVSLLTSALVVSANSTLPQTNSTCCSSLMRALPGIVFTPCSSQYGTLIASRWSNTAVLHPACVVRPKSSEDVSKALKVLVPGQCYFSIKSGGHNANPGADSIDDGVSLDLSQLNAILLADDRSYVTLGSGTTWGHAYNALNSSGIAFTGGICEDVGAGGVVIGGGQSLFQPRKGWVVDNILNYEIVLASGLIVNANQTSNPDLFKALKGGNTNFGIVTQIDVAAFDQGYLWGGEVLVSLQGPQATRSQCLDQISQATVNFTAGNNVDADSGIQLMTTYLSGNRGQMVLTAFANAEAVESPPLLRPFLELPNLLEQSAGHVKLADLVHQISQLQPAGYRQVTASITIFNDYETLREIWDQTDAIYNALPQKDQVDWMVSFIPQTKVQQSHASASGGNSLGLAQIERDQIVIWLTSRWTDSALDDMMSGGREEFIRVTTAVAKKHGTFHPFIYINYAAPTQDPLCGYGIENARFIKKTAEKYDPDGVFQKLMPGGFKISKSDCV